jgi:hypothetical protein
VVLSQEYIRAELDVEDMSDTVPYADELKLLSLADTPQSGECVCVCVICNAYLGIDWIDWMGLCFIIILCVVSSTVYFEISFKNKKNGPVCVCAFICIVLFMKLFSNSIFHVH